MAYADLHIHSTASDGTLSPEEIVRLCVENGVGALSVTDHDAVEGTLRAAPLARAAGLVYISGVEIDSLWRGRDVHVLCYGADLENGALLTCIREARARMDGMSDALLERMLKDFPALSKEEYAAFERDKTLGGWKMLHYLLFKGVTRSMTDEMCIRDRTCRERMPVWVRIHSSEVSRNLLRSSLVSVCAGRALPVPSILMRVPSSRRRILRLSGA